MTAPVVLPLPALAVELIARADGSVALWLKRVGSEAAERVGTIKPDARLRRGWSGPIAGVSETERAAITDALDAHFAAATP